MQNWSHLCAAHLLQTGDMAQHKAKTAFDGELHSCIVVLRHALGLVPIVRVCANSPAQQRSLTRIRGTLNTVKRLHVSLCHAGETLVMNAVMQHAQIIRDRENNRLFT